MKNILVPTDFSACASNATEAALDLAVRYNARIHLYSKIDIRYDWTTMSEEEKTAHPEDLRIIQNTELLFSEWKAKAMARGVEIKTVWSAGKLIENIIDYCNSYAIDFMVMGSHGASGKNEFFIGSNTQRVVRMVHCPVLIIKNDVQDYSLDKVVFASTFDEVEKKVFQYLLDFVRPFEPVIHLVTINTSGWFGQPYLLVKEAMDDFKALCGTLECHTHFYRDWTPDAGIRSFSREIGADLIAISNQQRHPLKRMFVGSNVEALVNHAEVPVLSIDLTSITVEAES
ncbi:MAG: universal stress protein [Bacteroidota bacterium]